MNQKERENYSMKSQGFLIMTDLKNPMRFSARPRDINIRKYLGEDRQVTEIEFKPGQIYVHWEER